MMNIDWTSRCAARTRYFKASSIREILKITARPEVISFAGGLPAMETLPIQAIADACQTVLKTQPDKALQYGPTEGAPPLREQIATLYGKQGIPLNVENILVTTGSQQGLDLIGRTLVDSGDRLVMEMPTYIGALQAWRPCQPQFVGVPMDADGMQVERIDVSEPIKFVYVLPNFQNPTGVSLSTVRRQQIVEMAHRHDFIIIEDDPYRALRYSGVDQPSLLQIEADMLGLDWNTQGRVIHLGTLSKVMAPGLRVAWMVAPAAVLRMFVLAKQGADLHSATLNQYIAAEMLRNGIIDGNIPHLIDVYRARRDAMQDALSHAIDGFGTWTHPNGGLFVWVTLPGHHTGELLKQALMNNVAFVPGCDFYFDNQGTDSMRLNFSCMPPERIEEGIARLGQIIAHEHAHIGVR